MTNGAHAWAVGVEPLTVETFAFPRRPILGSVLTHNRRNVNIGLAIGAFFSLMVHTFASVRAETALLELNDCIQETRRGIHAYYWASYEIDTPKEEPKKEDIPPPEPPPPAKEEPPVPVPVTHPIEDPYKNAPQVQNVAQAQKVETAPGPPDPYGDGMVSGDSDHSTGMQSANGLGHTGDTQKGHNENKGPENPGPPQPPKPDLSKPPTIAGGTAWSCPFPAEADADGIDNAIATIIVTVRPDGTPATVSVVSDPGSGFGRAARQCALGRRYQAGLDRDGNATTATTPPIRVRFSR